MFGANSYARLLTTAALWKVFCGWGVCFTVGRGHFHRGLLSSQVWDEELERSATHWAEECIWDHGPQDLLMSIGQNLAVHWGR